MVKVRAVADTPVQVESLDQEGRGVAHRDGKVIFIEGALPGETVTYAPYRKRDRFDLADAVEILKSSPLRSVPRCAHFGICGGCSLQHLDARAQVAVKQRVLEDNLWHIGMVRADIILPAIHGPAWGYRGRARFSARYVAKRGALIGFHEKRSTFVADTVGCEVVPERISKLLVPLRELVAKLSIRERMPQIELALGDDMDVLVMRVLVPPSAADEDLLRGFADQYHVQWFLQPRGPETATPFYPELKRPLFYSLPEFDLTIEFAPTDFTQVNQAVNAVLVRRAVKLLAPSAGELIADMFCGVGNFSLAIARSGARVVGVEGSRTLVAAAERNAVRNELAGQTNFVLANLYEKVAEKVSTMLPSHCMLIDPPRDGAIGLVKALPQEGRPVRIVYVSCNPATLARDAAVLVNLQGYELAAAGIVNMFPHTAHVESIAVFDRQ